jgi:hypothetical protein
MGHMIRPEEWERLVAPGETDRDVIEAVEASVPSDWMWRGLGAIMNGAAVVAVRYDRKHMAEALRSRVLFSSIKDDEQLEEMLQRVPDEVREVINFMFGRFEVTLLEIAEQLEHGRIGRE